jgi:hypothetical protein
MIVLYEYGLCIVISTTYHVIGIYTLVESGMMCYSMYIQMRELMTEPLYPTHTYPVFEQSTNSGRKKLKAVTWCMGDKPCRTLSRPITWTDKRKGR